MIFVDNENTGDDDGDDDNYQGSDDVGDGGLYGDDENGAVPLKLKLGPHLSKRATHAKV